MSRARLGRALDVSHRHLADLIEARVITPVTPGRGRRPSVFDALVAIPAALRHERQKSRPGESARDRRDHSQALLNEQKLAERAGMLVSREQVIREGRGLLLALRAALLAMPKRMTQLGLVAPDHEPKVRIFIHEALTALSKWDLAKVEEINRANGEADPAPDQTDERRPNA